jgi:hypothetical protein
MVVELSGANDEKDHRLGGFSFRLGLRGCGDDTAFRPCGGLPESGMLALYLSHQVPVARSGRLVVAPDTSIRPSLVTPRDEAELITDLWRRDQSHLIKV